MDILYNKKEPIVPDKYRSPYPVRTSDPPFSLVDQAREIENAESSLQNTVNAKLDVILKQIRHLQDEARSILEKAGQDMELHKIKCNFVKIPGQTVYLYEKKSSLKYFSIVSPQEWSNMNRDEFLGAYMLMPDRSFKNINLHG